MGLEVCAARLADSLEPPPCQTVSEWADQNRRLSSEASAERASGARTARPTKGQSWMRSRRTARTSGSW